MFDHPIVIIGSGLAGYTLAREFRKLDSESELLIITADDGVQYSKPLLSNTLGQGKSPKDLEMADPGKMAEQLNCTVRINTSVTGINAEAKTIFIGEEKVSYHKLVLALGAKPKTAKLGDTVSERIHSINDLTSLKKFHSQLESNSRVLIMGAGLIGCEFASDLSKAGHQVTVVAPGYQLMPGVLPNDVARKLQESLERAGVNFILGPLVTTIAQKDSEITATISNGQHIHADAVLSAIGIEPQIQLANTAGLTTNVGICVDRNLTTSNPDVYALGDCAEVEGHVLFYVMPLMASARALAKTLNGEQTAVTYPVMPVNLKTPSCPVAFYPPTKSDVGEWIIETEEGDIRALLKNQDQLLGFALTGALTKERLDLAKQIPALVS